MVALTSMALGVAAGTALVVIAYGEVRLGCYILLLAAYHMLEFISTYNYQQSLTTENLFLLYGSVGSGHYLLMQLFSFWEYFYIGSRWKSWNYLPCISLIAPIGIGMSILGLSMRHRAMKVCGAGFSHYIETTARESHMLITHDIYAYCRHPSYLGFYLFAAGLQLNLALPLSLILTLCILSYFFRVRIRFEEWFLEHRMFGQNYIDYKARVRTWIPFV